MHSFVSSIGLAVLLAQEILAVAEWQQCGGVNFSGSTTCDTGLTCVKISDWYSQCKIAKVTSAAAATSTVVSATTLAAAVSSASSGLKDLDNLFAPNGKLFWGTAADPGTINIAQNKALLESQFGGFTPENSMKVRASSLQVSMKTDILLADWWDATEATQNQFTFDQADQLVNFAISQGAKVRGHTLVWHSQLPEWVSQITNATELTSVIQSHVTTLMTRYKGKIYAWDVCNEVLNEDGTLRSSVFSNVLGEDFITIAFKAARAADPDAKLYIDDFNLDSNNAKVQGLVNLVKRVNADETLIDGIGSQSHLSAGGTGGVKSALTTLAGAASEVALTELDIAGASASDYTAVVNACLSVSNCVSITSWGVSDANSWRTSSTPLLFDTNYQPKAAYTAVIDALS